VPASKHRIYHRLQLAAHRLQKAADRSLLDAAGVTTPQAAVLATIDGQSSVTQKGVAKQLGVNESAMTAMINRLQSMGLVEKVQVENDARVWQLRLTEDGRATVLKARRPFAKLNGKIEQALNPDEVARLANYLERIANAFEVSE
jgi:MarR family transcriptional regulator, organic hydroperoxide resistance regulator